MIGPSKRQRSSSAKGQQTPTLQLHKRLAKRHYWQKRLFASSTAALAVSLLAWFLGLGLVWHLLSVLAGFLLGFLWPVASARRWAMSWIATHSGLSYETALELSSKPADPYGFAERVKVDAEEKVARLEPPAAQPWWLPLLALALGLALLPNIGAPQNQGLVFPSPPSVNGGASTEPETPPTDEDSALATESNEAEEQQPADATPESPSLADIPEDLPDVDSPGSRESQDATTGSAADSEALTRFLENIQEREISPDSLQETTGSTLSESTQSETDGDETTTNETGTEGESGQEDAQQGEQLGQEAEDGEANGGQQAPEDASEFADDSQQSPTEDGQQDNGANGGQSSSAPQDNEGADDSRLDEGSNTEAGALGTAPLPDTGLEGEPQGEPEFLPGQLGAGSASRGGEVRAPGVNESEVRGGSTSESYERALERAITEGRIPVEYQEILRNYFR